MFGRRRRDQPVALVDAESAAAEAFRILRTNMQLRTGGCPAPRSILITSAGWGEGKTTTTGNLALVYSQAGSRVLAIDANLRRPALHRMLVAEMPGKGLTTVLTYEDSLERAVLAGPWEGLHILPAGPTHQSPTDLLDAKSTQRLLEAALEQYDMVLIDSAPVLGLADTLALGYRTDGVLMAVRSGASTLPRVKQARDSLTSVGARVLGVVLDGLKPAHDAASR